MKSRLWKIIALILAASLVAGLILIGCSGGSGGESTSSTAGNGTLALFLSDGPADEYDEIWISICKISLIPGDDDSDDSEIVIFNPDVCFKVDLLKLRDEEILLTIKEEIPAVFYAKIRLEVETVEGTGGPCGVFKLPSGKIDLNPRGGIYVESGRTLAVKFDMDANKSINLHEAGKSGKCIFRPVVFVDIESIEAPPQRCPRILNGEIDSLIENDDSGQTEGFVLDLAGERGLIKVLLSDDPVIFGENGKRAEASALAVGQQVRVRAKLMSAGVLEASVIVIGDVFSVNGTVVSPVNNAIFPLWLDPGQGFVGEQLDVEISRATLILTGCDEEVGYEAIQRGRRARVIGKHDVDLDVFRAVAILIESERIIGDLIALERPPADYSGDAIAVLTIKDDEANEHDIFQVEGSPVYLQGYGEISLGLLKPFVDNCKDTQPKRAAVDLDLEAVDPTSMEIRVQQERMFGQVVEIRDDRVLLLDGGRLVRIQEEAHIRVNRKHEDEAVGFGSIVVGSWLTLYGLSDCNVAADEVEFYAFIVLIDELSYDDED